MANGMHARTRILAIARALFLSFFSLSLYFFFSLLLFSLFSMFPLPTRHTYTDPIASALVASENLHPRLTVLQQVLLCRQH